MSEKYDPTDPASRNAQLDEEKARLQNAGKDGRDTPLKPHDKADPAKLQEVVPRASGNSGQDHSAAAQWGRETYGSTPRDITFATDSGKVIFGKEYGDNGKPMLLASDGTRYEGTLNADGNGIASWQQVQKDGKLGPAMNVTAERSGLPPNQSRPETYVNSNQARVQPQNEGGGNPARPTAPVGDSTNPRTQRANTPEAPNQTLNFAPLHKGDVPPPAQANNPDKLVARGGDSSDKANQPAKPDRVETQKPEAKPDTTKPDTTKPDTTKPEQSPRADRATTGGGITQPFDAAPRQQRPVNEAQPGKPDGGPRAEAGKPHDGPNHPAERGKPGGDIFPAAPTKDNIGLLLMRSNPEAAKHLADLITAMQSGKGIIGRDNLDAVKMLQGLKPEQLTGLRNALTDGKFNFDINQLDGKTQGNLTKLFEQLSRSQAEGGLRLGGMQDLGAGGRVLDLLQGKQFDKVPSGDQTKQILAELFKGFKDGGTLAGGMDLSALLGRSLARPGEVMIDGRALGQIPGMKFDLKDAGPLMQTLMARMELGKINEGSINQLGKLADTLAQKLDTKDGATLEVKAELKTQNTLDIGKLGDAVRSALLNGELGRAVGREQGKDAQLAQKDAMANPAMQADGGPTKQSDLTAAIAKTETEQSQKRLEEEAAKQKKQQEESAETIKPKGPTPEQLAEELAQKQRLEEQRKAQEKEEKERKEREEKKRKEDAERVHVVKKGETLHVISRKYFSNDKNAQIIYARNKSTIKVVNYKGQPYCSLKEGQKLYIPSPKFVDNFMKGTSSYNHINFGKIPFSTPEEELAFLFGGADLGAAAGLLGINKKRPSLFNHDQDSEAPTRRSFSGKEALDDDERRANVEQILNPAAAAKKPVEMDGIKHTVRLGETLSSIALRRYGQAAYWRLIAWKNKLGLVDSTAHSKMTRGLILFMPTNDEMSAYDADPDRMLSLTPSRTGIFIESENRISMPALKVCPECGRTTLYTAQSCMRCETDLSDIPIIIDALGVGVELDLVDLDGHLPGEESDETNSKGNGNGNGASPHEANGNSFAHRGQYQPSSESLRRPEEDMSKELTDSVVPHKEVEHMDPAVLAAMTQPESQEEVDHVGDIPLPDVAFARRQSQQSAPPVSRSEQGAHSAPETANAAEEATPKETALAAKAGWADAKVATGESEDAAKAEREDASAATAEGRDAKAEWEELTAERAEERDATAEGLDASAATAEGRDAKAEWEELTAEKAEGQDTTPAAAEAKYGARTSRPPINAAESSSIARSAKDAGPSIERPDPAKDAAAGFVHDDPSDAGVLPHGQSNKVEKSQDVSEDAMNASELMQHTEEDEAAMMDLFPDCASILDESIVKCEYVDDMVRIAERGDVDSRDGLCITLEMVSDGQWSKVCQYRIYGFNCFIEFYCRANGSRRPERVQEKSLQSKIASEMAWNHFTRNWQEICTDFWHS
ncbi:MAG: LysM peptidoglycan-binding domain-containing protein [Candidatus Obscuribacterales bacterium]|nr:LysM peptidoglycan-binding domain-containing protein [Candidatus Obscuribacterales bacterium]